VESGIPCREQDAQEANAGDAGDGITAACESAVVDESQQETSTL
jgi:hypothetical protein